MRNVMLQPAVPKHSLDRILMPTVKSLGTGDAATGVGSSPMVGWGGPGADATGWAVPEAEGDTTVTATVTRAATHASTNTAPTTRPMTRPRGVRRLCLGGGVGT